MAEQVTVKIPDFDDSGLTEAAQEEVKRVLQDLKDQFNTAIADLEKRVTALE